MRILVMGGNGMLGHKIFQSLGQEFDTYATFRGIDGPWREFPIYRDTDHVYGGVDALEFGSAARAVRTLKPEVVVNCIGVIKQRKEVSDPITSISVNSLFPHRLAAMCMSAGVRMIHMSTDCVFSGRKGCYTEDDVSDAEDIYGRTKFLGEVHNDGCLTIRSSVFGRDFLTKNGLLEWFLSNRGGRVSGYKNVVFNGFPTVVFARIIRDIISDYPKLSGLYHVATEPINKYNLLVRIRTAMNLEIEIEPSEYPRSDRTLDASRFIAATGYKMPSWDSMITELAKDQTPYGQWRKQNEAV